MKKGRHPRLNILDIVMTDGTLYTTASTSAKSFMRLEVDTKSHYIWNNKENVVDRGGQLVKFKKRYNKK